MTQAEQDLLEKFIVDNEDLDKLESELSFVQRTEFMSRNLSISML